MKTNQKTEKVPGVKYMECTCNHHQACSKCYQKKDIDEPTWAIIQSEFNRQNILTHAK